MASNLRAVQRVAAAGAGTSVEVLAVVKADAYGHDAAQVALFLTQVATVLTQVATVLTRPSSVLDRPAPAPAEPSPGPEAVRWLGVSDCEEGARVRQALGPGSNARILVMCGLEPDDAPALLAHDLTPVVWTPAHVAALQRAGRAANQVAPVHLEIDTGMARQGAAPGSDLAATLAELSVSPWVHCEGVLSHLAAAEVVSPQSTWGAAQPAILGAARTTAAAGLTERQRARFSAALEQITAAGIRPGLLHLGNSSAVDEGSTLAWVAQAAQRLGARPMVRTGLALYGHCLPLEGAGPGAPAAAGNAAETTAGNTAGISAGNTAGNAAETTAGNSAGRLAPHLQPALTWKTRIIGMREIAAGDTVGYGATFTAAAPMRLALLPVGYADGFRRAASSSGGSDWVHGWVCIAGQRAPVVGRVSMNLTTVDVTAIPQATLGGEVVLLGAGVSAEDHAAWSGTIAYDILCGIRGRVRLVP